MKLKSLIQVSSQKKKPLWDIEVLYDKKLQAKIEEQTKLADEESRKPLSVA